MKALLLGLLAASVVGNVALLLRGRSTAAASTPEATAPLGERAAPPTVVHRQASEPMLTSCAKSLATYREEVQKLQTELEKALPIDQRFLKGAPNPAAQQRLEPEIKRLVEQGGSSYTIECRGDVCSVEMLHREGEAEQLAEGFQRDRALKSMVTGFRFEAGTPTKDPVSGKAMWQEKVLLRVGEKAPAGEGGDGLNLLDAAYRRFLQSGAPAKCNAEAPSERGIWEVRLDIDEAGVFTIHAGGTLSDRPAGKCLAAQLEAATQSVEIKGAIQPAVSFYTVHLPP